MRASGDCNDGNAAIHPGAHALCNGIDDNCSGQFDDDALGVDTDADGIRNVCDLNDGLIYVVGPADRNFIQWRPESGPTSWNVYEGDLSVIRASGVYTQAPGSNPLADRQSGFEGSLGTNSAGAPRANTNPCP